MSVLVACEHSQVVTKALRKRGVTAYSCDLIAPTGEYKEWHIKGDVRELLCSGWNMMIAFPPCDHLAVSGARWFEQKRKDGRQQAAIDFFMKLVKAPIPRIAIENPVGIMSTVYRKPDQIIQPYQFGHGEQKRTCLWLKNLPPLMPTKLVDGRRQRIWRMAPSEIRGQLRGLTYPGIAEAMAEQWQQFGKAVG